MNRATITKGASSSSLGASLARRGLRRRRLRLVRCALSLSIGASTIMMMTTMGPLRAVPEASPVIALAVSTGASLDEQSPHGLPLVVATGPPKDPVGLTGVVGPETHEIPVRPSRRLGGFAEPVAALSLAMSPATTTTPTTTTTTAPVRRSVPPQTVPPQTVPPQTVPPVTIAPPTTDAS
jgi:hypothetical protein